MKAKKIISYFVLMCMLVCSASSTNAEFTQSDERIDKRPTLSAMTEAECIEFLKKNEIPIPNDFKDQDWLGEFITKTIRAVEENPAYPFAYGYAVTLDFANSIKDAVNSYYGIEEIALSQLMADGIYAPTRYTLQDSTVYGSWSDTYLDYNCYGYALGRTDIAKSPGYFSAGSFDINLPIFSMAALVKNDLKSSSFSQNCVKLTTIRPSSVAAGETAICIRKGHNDFHFMKLFGSTWRHKPGRRAILQYNYLPSTSRNWTNENSLYGIAYEGDTVYNSDIYYIIFKSNHNSTYKWTGEHYHSGSRHYFQYGYICNGCGEITGMSWTNVACSGPPCQMPRAG
ncbi:MAG: hypothetical protein FWH17_06600 [Oscillospiraceae bacterium]|nr:hypothetical protein [Oscillospiraceae bacterium]